MLRQDEIDAVRDAAGGESVATMTVQAGRRARDAAAYEAWNESLPDEVKADLKAWDEAPIPV